MLPRDIIEPRHVGAGQAHGAHARRQVLDLRHLELPAGRLGQRLRQVDDYFSGRRKTAAAPAMATAQTGAIVITNGRIVSLAECESRSNAANTITVPQSSSTSPMPSAIQVDDLIALVCQDGVGERGRRSWHRRLDVDYHTAGEPFRIVSGGVPAPRGRTILEK